MTDQRAASIGQIEQLFQQITWQGRHHFARRLQAFGLTVPQYLALETIARLGPNATMGEVGEAIQLPPSSMTGIVDRLVRDGLVERGTLANDRRAVASTITPAGQTLVATVQRRKHEDLTAMLEGLSEADLSDFVRVLTLLAEGVERLQTAGLVPAGSDTGAALAARPR
jgi:MarR family transcriptional regulator for hemolysin